VHESILTQIGERGGFGVHRESIEFMEFLEFVELKGFHSIDSMNSID
jgi:hypothetical protein